MGNTAKSKENKYTYPSVDTICSKLSSDVYQNDISLRKGYKYSNEFLYRPITELSKEGKNIFQGDYTPELEALLNEKHESNRASGYQVQLYKITENLLPELDGNDEAYPSYIVSFAGTEPKEIENRLIGFFDRITTEGLTNYYEGNKGMLDTNNPRVQFEFFGQAFLGIYQSLAGILLSLFGGGDYHYHPQ